MATSTQVYHLHCAQAQECKSARVLLQGLQAAVDTVQRRHVEASSCKTSQPQRGVKLRALPAVGKQCER